jgi:hypothetical protein
MSMIEQTKELEAEAVGSFDDFFAEATAPVDDAVVEPVTDDFEKVDEVIEADVAPVVDSPIIQPDDDYKTKYEQELQRTKSWDGRLSAKDREVNALKEELERVRLLAQAKADADPNDDTDDASVTAFLEEFPELAAPIQKMIEKVTRQHGKKVADDITSNVDRRLAPIAQTVQETTVAKHVSTIRAAHNDFEALVQGEDLQTWINEQPKYMQPALRDVYERGYAEDVVDMLTQYKDSRGLTSQVADHKANSPTPQPIVKKQPTAAVKSRHSTPPTTPRGQIAEDDFDGAWAAAMKQPSS